MKLHLPKMLMVAVLATCILASTSRAGEWGTINGGTDNAAYYITSAEEGSINTTTGDQASLSTVYIAPGSGITEATMDGITMKKATTLIFTGANESNFSSLLIESFTVDGSAQGDTSENSKIQIEENQNVIFGSLSGTITLSEGNLTLRGTNNSGRVNLLSGTLVIDQANTTLHIVDGGMSGRARGGVLIKENAGLTVTTSFYNHINNSNGIQLEKDATLSIAGLTLKGLSSEAGSLASLKRVTGGGQYGLGAGDYTISNGEVQVANGGTINNKLTNVILKHTANNTLTVSNSGNTVTNVDISNGRVNLTNTGSLTANVTGSGTLALQSALTSLDATGDGTVQLSGVITGDYDIATGLHLSSKLTVSGSLEHTGSTLTISDISDFGASYSDGDNGILSAGTVYFVETSGDSASATTTATTVVDASTNESYTLTVQDGKWSATIAAGSSNAYYVNAGEVNYGGENSKADAMANGIIMKGGTLNLNQNLDLNTGAQISTRKAGSIINIAGGVTLKNEDVSGGSIKSTVAGGTGAVYDMGSVTWEEGAASNGGQSPNVTFGSNWEGTTVITNSTITNHNLNAFGYYDENKTSTLKLVGVTGWMALGGKVNLNVELENYVDADNTANNRSAFIFNDNSKDKTYTFAKKISGSGDFQIASRAGDACNIVFSGDTSAWTGGMKVTPAFDGTTNTPTITVKMTGGGNIFSATGNKGFEMDRAGTINLEIGHASNASIMNGAITMTDNADTLNLKVTGDTEFKQAVEVSSLTVDADKTATLEATTATGTLTTNGTVKVTGDGSLTYGGNTTVTAPAAVTFGTETSGAEITSTAITGGVVTFTGDADVTESRTISDSAIVNNATGTANISVGAQNASVNAAAGNIAMTTTDANGTTVGDLTIAAGKQVSSTGDLTVTSLTISGTDALTVTGALNLDNATVNLTGLTLAQDQTIYTLGTATSISAAGVTVQLTEDQLTAAGFDAAKTTCKVDAATDNPGSLVLTLTVEPAEPALTTINVTGVDVQSSSAGALTLTTAENATDAVFGGALDAVMDDTTWADIKAELKEAGITLNDSIAITFVGADGTTFDFNGANDDLTAPTITINGEGTQGAQVITGTPDGTVVGNYVTAYIPEPTSTTLSLLALAALAVRRRRK